MSSVSGPAAHQLETDLLTLRYWQHVINEKLKLKEFTVPIHVALGTEALAVAVHHMLQTADQLVLTHRNISYNLMQAGALGPIYDEYKSLSTGASAGHMGSMNLINPDQGVMYTSSILGNNYSVGCGLALAKKVQQQPGYVVILTGDGAMEEGAFYESLVFARSHQLPVLIVIENNNHSLASTIDQRRSPIAVAHLCAAVGVPYLHLHSNDVIEYAGALQALRMAAEEQQLPACVEADMSLLNQHAGPTPGWPTDTMKAALQDGLVLDASIRDPLHVLRTRMGAERFDAQAAAIIQKGWN